MPQDEKNFTDCFTENAPKNENKNEESANFVHGDAEMPENIEDLYEHDEEENEEVKNRIEDILILLAAWKYGNADKYKKFFTEQGVRVISVSNEDEFLNFTRVFPINGVASDFSTEDINSESTKKLFSELQTNYPFIQVKINENTDNLEIISKDGEIKTLEDFIEKKCLSFASRTLRSNQRVPISLNVEISPEKEFLRVERSVTLNISQSGLFVLAMSPLWNEAKKCFICVKEFNSESLIECNIVRQVRWGEKPFQNPGIGVEIVAVHESLQDNFNTLLEKWRLF